MQKIEVLSSIPGRIRLRVPALYHRKDCRRKIESYLGNCKGIKKVRADHRTGKVLLIFEPKLQQGELTAKLLRALYLEDHAAVLPPRENTQNPPLWQMIISGAMLVFFAIKQKLWGKSALCNDFPLLCVSSGISMIAGYPVLKKAFEGITRRGKINYEAVMSIAVLTTIALRESLWGLSVIFLLNLSSVLEHMALKGLERLYPDAFGDGLAFLKNSDLTPAEIFAVKAQEVIFADGQVTEGQALVDESIVNGSFSPRLVTTGDEVLAGSRVIYGEVAIRAEKVGQDTQVGQNLLQLSEKEESNGDKLCSSNGEIMADRITPVSTLTSLGVVALTGDYPRALAMLLAACPNTCSLSETLPMKLGKAKAARQGIFIRNTSGFEKMSRLDAMLFDKTGTLTEVKPMINRIRAAESYTENGVLEIAASLELDSLHPLSKAILAEAQKRKLDIKKPSAVREIAGGGLIGYVTGEEVIVGNINLMEEYGVFLPPRDLDGFRDFEGIAVYVAVQKKLIGIIEIIDTPKPDAAQVVKDIRHLGVKELAILTGDRSASAERAAGEFHINIDSIQRGLSPEQKAQMVKKYRKNGYKVALVGDGINDIPAMREADAAVSFGRGLAPAHDFADVVVLSEDLKALPISIEISRQVLDVTAENLVISAVLNFIGLLLAALNIMNPFATSIYHDINSLIVILNSTKILQPTRVNMGQNNNNLKGAD